MRRAMAETAADYHHGDQDDSQQVATYHLFYALTKWGALTLSVLITTFTLWFCVGAGFFASVITGAILAAVGIYFLRSKPPQKV